MDLIHRFELRTKSLLNLYNLIYQHKLAQISTN